MCMASTEYDRAFRRMLRYVEDCQEEVCIEIDKFLLSRPNVTRFFIVRVRVDEDEIYLDCITHAIQWILLGEAIGRSPSCRSFSLVEKRKYPDNSHLEHLFDGLKENKRINSLYIKYSRDGPMFDLNYFLERHTDIGLRFDASVFSN